MKTIEVRTQAEWDALEKEYNETVKIVVSGEFNRIDTTPVGAVVVLSGSAKIDYVSGSAKIDYVYGSAKIGSVYDSAKIGSVSDSAKIGSVYDSAKIGSVSGSAKIDSVYGSAKIDYVSGSAKIGSVYDSAKIGSVSDSAKIGYVSGQCVVSINSKNVEIGQVGLFSVIIMWGVLSKIGKVAKTATVVKKKITDVSNKMISECLEREGELYIFYKSVNPVTSCDFYTGKIKYEGDVIAPDWDSSQEKECGGGLHVSPTPGQALSYNRGKLLRVGVKLKDFVIYQGNLSKVRCRKLVVLGEYKND